MKFQALIFDHDGTLVDSEVLHFACWRDLMAGYDVIISEQEYIDQHNGMPTLQNAENLILTYNLNLGAAPLAAKKSDLFALRSKQQAPPLMPTVMRTLQLAQAKGLTMAVATGADQSDLARSLQAHQLVPYFKTTASRNEVKAGKPAPDVYLLACERLQVEPEKCCAFEDTAAGIAAAKAAGLYCIAIPNAYSARQDLSQADKSCTSLFDAVEYAIAL